MNAAIVESFDLAPRYGAFSEPMAGEGEVIVQVSAAGLHPIVRALASGTHYGATGELPFIPGVDGVGRLEDGTRVFFGVSRKPFGSMAERAPARRGMCLPLPDGLDDATAAALANPGMSSWVALAARAQLAAGESVLILGATGVAGRLAVQVAKQLGAGRVIAAGRNPEALDQLKDLGADSVVSLNADHSALVEEFRRQFAEGGVNVVLDYLWGRPAEAVLEAISRKGLSPASPRVRYIEIGESAGKSIALPAATLRSSGLELLGSGFGSASLTQIFQALRDFFTAAASGRFAIDVKTAPLADAEKLWVSREDRARLVFVT